MSNIKTNNTTLLWLIILALTPFFSLPFFSPFLCCIIFLAWLSYRTIFSNPLESKSVWWWAWYSIWVVPTIAYLALSSSLYGFWADSIKYALISAQASLPLPMFIVFIYMLLLYKLKIFKRYYLAVFSHLVVFSGACLLALYNSVKLANAALIRSCSDDVSEYDLYTLHDFFSGPPSIWVVLGISLLFMISSKHIIKKSDQTLTPKPDPTCELSSSNDLACRSAKTIKSFFYILSQAMAPVLSIVFILTLIIMLIYSLTGKIITV